MEMRYNCIEDKIKILGILFNPNFLLTFFVIGFNY